MARLLGRRCVRNYLLILALVTVLVLGLSFLLHPLTRPKIPATGTMFSSRHTLLSDKMADNQGTSQIANEMIPKISGQKKRERKIHRRMDSLSDLIEVVELAPLNITSYKMVVAILTAKRDPPTVVRMARGLVESVREEEEYKFLVWVSYSAAKETQLIEELAGLGFTVYVNTQNYSEVEDGNVKITWNDSPERVVWRTTHVLDYANLLERVLLYESEFVMVLEDDLQPAKFAVVKTHQFAKLHFAGDQYPSWAYLSMYSGKRQSQIVARVTQMVTGACALVIRRSLISGIIERLRADPYEAPADILLYSIMLEKRLVIYERTPNLFQHISPHSSYTGKDQVQRQTERMRSISYQHDEDNRTLSFVPSKTSNGYIGCFRDRVEDRDLNGLYAYRTDGPRYRRPNPKLCAEFCQGYFFFGLQFGGDCHCGNEFGRYGQAPESECDSKCSNSSDGCGGPVRNSVYRTHPFLATYIGCFKDSSIRNVSKELSSSIDTASPDKCEQFCRNRTAYFALQKGTLCICSDSYDVQGRVDEERCSMRCRDHYGHWCGGEQYSSVYQI